MIKANAEQQLLCFVSLLTLSWVKHRSCTSWDSWAVTTAVCPSVMKLWDPSLASLLPCKTGEVREVPNPTISYLPLRESWQVYPRFSLSWLCISFFPSLWESLFHPLHRKVLLFYEGHKIRGMVNVKQYDVIRRTPYCIPLDC